jgi:hypothetical protein
MLLEGKAIREGRRIVKKRYRQKTMTDFPGSQCITPQPKHVTKEKGIK